MRIQIVLRVGLAHVLMFAGGQSRLDLSAGRALLQLWRASLSSRAWGWAQRARTTTRRGVRLEQGPERRRDNPGHSGTMGPPDHSQGRPQLGMIFGV